MRTFTNTEFTKQQAVDLAKAHQEADAFTQKTYGQYNESTGMWNGCSVGCMAKGNNHSGYESKFGIDKRIAYLSDRIFENLKQGEHKNFTLDLFESIPENIDSTKVYYQFMHWLLVDSEFGVIQFSKNKSVVENVANLYQRAIVGDYPTRDDWSKARKKAYAETYAAYAAKAYAAAGYAAADYADAADAAGYAAADATAAAADYDAADYDDYAAAAYAAGYAAADAAYAAAAAYVYDRTKHYRIMRDKLIQLFRDAKPC